MLGAAEHATGGRPAHRIAAARPAAGGAARVGVAARPASSSVRTRCSARTSQFADLGLVVVDEQHRFGVEQRAALGAKAAGPAARAGDDRDPDPALGGDDGVRRPRDVSTLREIPAGRAEVSTVVVDARASPGWVDRAWQRVVRGGGRGPPGVRRLRPDLLDDQRRTAGPTATRSRTVDRRRGRAAGRRRRGPVRRAVGRAAGRTCASRCCTASCRREEKDAVMARFAAGETDVLVATTVIEVGVDVPNASVMVICDADRFGISQLHQLRGRIGRGGHPGVCLLLTTADAGHPGPGAAGRRGRHPGRLRAGRGRPRAAPRGRRARAPASPGSRSSLRLLRVLDDADLIAEARELADALRRRRPRAGRPRAWPTSSPTSSGRPPATGWSARGPGLERPGEPRSSPAAAAAAGSQTPPRATRPGRRPTGCARRCSPRSPPGRAPRPGRPESSPGRAGVPRPVRRLGRGRAGGGEPRRRAGAAGRVRRRGRRP